MENKGGLFPRKHLQRKKSGLSGITYCPISIYIYVYGSYD